MKIPAPVKRKMRQFRFAGTVPIYGRHRHIMLSRAPPEGAAQALTSVATGKCRGVNATMIIAVDGPAASGKGTIAKGLAAHFGLAHLDTGLLYRAVGLALLNELDAPDFDAKAVKAAKAINTGKLDAERLGAADVALAAAKVARIEDVREALRQFQRDFARRKGGAILDGRDIGTRICPDADAKLFITATPEIRARRRTAQLQARGEPVSVAEMLRQIIARDESDTSNPAGAFYRAGDAHLLDTTQMDIEAALRAAIAIVEAAVTRKSGQD
jgi:cytidylate kinase